MSEPNNTRVPQEPARDASAPSQTTRTEYIAQYVVAQFADRVELLIPDYHESNDQLVQDIEDHFHDIIDSGGKVNINDDYTICKYQTRFDPSFDAEVAQEPGWTTDASTVEWGDILQVGHMEYEWAGDRFNGIWKMAYAVFESNVRNAETGNVLPAVFWLTASSEITGTADAASFSDYAEFVSLDSTGPKTDPQPECWRSPACISWVSTNERSAPGKNHVHETRSFATMPEMQWTV